MEKIEVIGIPIEEAMKILRKAGLDVSRDETEKIMEFLCNLTQLVLEKYVKPP
jgi:hypothetical protein